MADQYLLKVGIDFSQAELDRVTGVISDQLVGMGEISDEFIDKALATAQKYNQELEKQRKIVADVEKRLKSADLDDATKALLEQTKAKSEQVIKDYTYGNKEKGLDSKAVVDAVADYAGAMKSAGEAGSNFGGMLNGAVGKVAAFSAGMQVAYKAVKAFVDQVSESVDKMAEYANKLDPLGAFGSSSQRALMTRYGMSGTEALGFGNVLEAMGMSESDIGKMTAEQREVFQSLMQFWNEGIGKLNPDALERYTDVMQEYQEIQAKYNMGLQMVVLKLVTNSDSFNKLVGTLGDFMDNTLNFLSSPIVQTVFNGLIDFLNTVFTILNAIMKLISYIPGFGGSGGSVTTNNTTNNTNSTYNIYGMDFRSNDELARQISYSSMGGYRG